MVEGAPLLREYGQPPSRVRIPPSPPRMADRIINAITDGIQHLYAPVAQLDRVLDYESRGRGFESLRARHCHTKVVWLQRSITCAAGSIY